MTVRYRWGTERPTLQLWVRDDTGDLYDFSSGYTFAFRVGPSGGTAVLNKTSNITGAAGAGTEPDGTPNVVVTWTAGELELGDGTQIATYLGLLIPTTTGGLDLDVEPFPFTIIPTIST